MNRRTASPACGRTFPVALLVAALASCVMPSQVEALRQVDLTKPLGEVTAADYATMMAPSTPGAQTPAPISASCAAIRSTEDLDRVYRAHPTLVGELEVVIPRTGYVDPGRALGRAELDGARAGGTHVYQRLHWHAELPTGSTKQHPYEVHVFYYVYRVEPAGWGLLPEALRPMPLRDAP